VQPLKKVTIRPSNGKNNLEIRATGNHRWVKTDGSVVSTNGLKEGDQLPFAAAPRPEIDEDYNLGVIHGMVYGDGAACYSFKRLKGYHLRLCGEKTKFAEWFTNYSVTYPPSLKGDALVYLYDNFAQTHLLKELPAENESESYLLGFVRGWLAMDGSVNPTLKTTSLWLDSRGLDWVQRNGPRLGFAIQNTQSLTGKTNYGERNKEIFRVLFDRASVTSEDVLDEDKKSYLEPLERTFRVLSVEDTGEEEEVFCAEVPDTNTFTLSRGLVTGNCAYLPVDHPRSFDEAMYILLCGTGVGYSVEKRYTEMLPWIPDTLEKNGKTILVKDSKEGWCRAVGKLIRGLYYGQIYYWDTSEVRPSGARLKTFGGRASGPAPLEELLEFVLSVFKGAAGRRLTPLESHDILCKIAQSVVVGGVRRSAMISLSDLEDQEMANAIGVFEVLNFYWEDDSNQRIEYRDTDGRMKHHVWSPDRQNDAYELSEIAEGRVNWWRVQPQRALANNSAVYEGKPDDETFMEEWTALVKSKSGERGIFNRQAAKEQAKKNGRRDWDIDYGTNPCSK